MPRFVGIELSQHNFHAFGGGTNFGIVVAGVLYYFVHGGICVVGVVMVENQFFGAAFHYYIHGFAPVAVSPAVAAGFIFFGKILRIVDEDVGAFGEFAHGFVKFCIAGFVVGRID